jgi:hypothetical protein
VERDGVLTDALGLQQEMHYRELLGIVVFHAIQILDWCRLWAEIKDRSSLLSMGLLPLLGTLPAMTSKIQNPKSKI